LILSVDKICGYYIICDCVTILLLFSSILLTKLLL